MIYYACIETVEKPLHHLAMVNVTTTEKPVNPWPAYVLILAIIVAIGAWTAWEPFARDQGIHATIAAGLLEGHMTYSEIYNMKPPTTTLFHATAQLVFGHNVSSIRFLDLVLVAVTSVLMCSLLTALRFSLMAATLAVVGVISVYYGLSFWQRSQTDGWAGFLLVPVLWLLVFGWRNEKRWPIALAGAILALSFTVKYTIGALGIVIFAPLLIDDLHFKLKDFWAFVFGGISVLVLFFIGLMALGAWPAFLETQAFTVNYAVGLRLSAFSTFLEAWKAMLGNPLVFIAGNLGVVLIFARIILGPRDLASAVLAAWVIAGVASLVSQGKGFPYHGLPMMIAVSACMAPVLDLFFKRSTWVARASAFPVMALGLIVILALGNSTKNATNGWQNISKGQPVTDYGWADFDVGHNRQAVAFLKSNLAPEETLFLWGYATQIYFETGRAPLHRFPYSWPFLASSGTGLFQNELMDRLNELPPDVIVIENNDATPWVSGIAADSRDGLNEFSSLAGFIAENYSKFGETPRFEYYRRVP